MKGNELKRLIQRKHKYHSFQFLKDILVDIFEESIPDRVKRGIVRKVIEIKLNDDDIFD